MSMREQEQKVEEKEEKSEDDSSSPIESDEEGEEEMVSSSQEVLESPKYDVREKVPHVTVESEELSYAEKKADTSLTTEPHLMTESSKEKAPVPRGPKKKPMDKLDRLKELLERVQTIIRTSLKEEEMEVIVGG
jgi:hypothetical protein